MKRNQEMLAPAEAARRLGVELNYVYSLLRIGKLAGRKNGKRWLVPAAAIEARMRQLEGNHATVGR